MKPYTKEVQTIIAGVLDYLQQSKTDERTVRIEQKGIIFEYRLREKDVLKMKLLNKLFNKQFKIDIEFCQKNLDRFVTEENYSNYDTFLQSKYINYKEYECQSRCKECKQAPYAIIDGQFISKESSRELLEALQQFIERKRKA